MKKNIKGGRKRESTELQILREREGDKERGRDIET
jgi:hypothetical protein